MTTNATFISEVLKLTNEFRTQNGLPALKSNAELQATAQGHSQDMAVADYFSHTGKDGSAPWDRAKRVGYAANSMGENIAAGQTTAQSVVQGWIDSPGHRANLLNRSYTELGVGYFLLENDTGSVNYNHYWTQVFGSGDTDPSSNIPPTPTPTPTPAPTPTPTVINGTSGNDTLTAGSGSQTIYGYSGNDVIRAGAGNDTAYGQQGQDTIYGEDGDDLLTGGSGKDTVIGGSGKDTLIGTFTSGSTSAGRGEIDNLTGNAGADRFVLGDRTSAFYNDGITSSSGVGDYAAISDFSLADGDIIQLKGSASDYRLATASSGLPSGTAIFLKNSGVDELIGIVQNANTLSLTSPAFAFV